MKIHVFVDDNNNVVSITPATTLPTAGQTASSGGVVFSNEVFAQQGARLDRYELDTEGDLSLDLDQMRDASELHEKCAQAIKTGNYKKL